MNGYVSILTDNSIKMYVPYKIIVQDCEYSVDTLVLDMRCILFMYCKYIHTEFGCYNMDNMNSIDNRLFDVIIKFATRAERLQLDQL